MRRIVAALFAAIIGLSLGGCENVSYTGSNSAADTTSDIYEELVSELPDDPEFAGREYVIVTNDKTAFYQDEESSGTINAAIEERNSFIEQKYGVDVVVREESESKVADAIKAANEAGTAYCDLLSISAKQTAALYVAGLLTDMNTLEGFDASSKFFDSRLATSLATNQSLYMLADPTALVYDNAYVIFFNRTLLETNGLDNPENLVMQGKWTWDAMYSMIKVAAASVMNKASSDTQTDTYGLGAYYCAGSFPIVMWASCGTPITGNTYKTDVTFALGSDTVIEKTQTLKSYYNSRALMPLDKNNLAKAFTDGRLVFMCHRLEYIHALRSGGEEGAEYGFVPMPKYDDAQENYYCYVGTDSRVLSVPAGITDGKKTAAMITATCAAGGQTVKDAFVRSYIALYMNNNGETVMLQTVADSICFDFTAVYGSQIKAINAASIEAIVNYIDYGSSISNTLSTKTAAFVEYADENFNNSP